MTRTYRTAVGAALALVASAALWLAPGTSAARAAASPGAGVIGPGVQMVTGGDQCTANFVFRIKKRLYVGYAAHCAGKGSASDTNGCTTASRPLGTRVTFVSGATILSGGTVLGRGRLAYSSWIAMHRAHTRSAGACRYNDLALVRVRWADRHLVDPTVPVFGGPTGLARHFPAAGRPVYSLGNSSLRWSSRARTGTVQSHRAWTMTVRSHPVGIPGDSGSGYLDRRGRAVGVLSTIDLFPDTGANGVGSLFREVRFARHHGMKGLRLVKGTRAFDADAAAPSGGLLGIL